LWQVTALLKATKYWSIDEKIGLKRKKGGQLAFGVQGMCGGIGGPKMGRELVILFCTECDATALML
jgi:hypothetical protein